MEVVLLITLVYDQMAFSNVTEHRPKIWTHECSIGCYQMATIKGWRCCLSVPGLDQLGLHQHASTPMKMGVS